MATDQPKPGVKTTEFWLSALLALVGPIVTLLVGTDVFSAADAAAVTENITTNSTAIVQSVTLIVANVTSLLGVGSYVRSRTAVKSS